jgi:hypothetical protein
VLSTNDALTTPFSLLSSTVRDLCSGGRRALGATLKPELFRRYRLTEQQLGFLKFGDFLRAAERAGFVQLHSTPGGDVEVWPTSLGVVQPVPISAAASSIPSAATVKSWSGVSHEGPPVRVRIDLWNAFTSFSSRWVYDAMRDFAYRVPDGATAEGAQGAGAQLIPIPPGRDRMISWMRSFAEVQDPDTRSRLQAALDGDSAPYHFTSSVRANLRLHKSWRRYHVRQVVAAIETWAASNNVRPKDVTSAYIRPSRFYWPPTQAPEPPVAAAVPETTTPTAAPAVPVLAPPSSAATLTPRLATLIDQLIDELLRLRGALQVIDPKH